METGLRSAASVKVYSPAIFACKLPMAAGAGAIATGRVDAEAFVEPLLANALAGGQLRVVPGVFSAIAPSFLFAAWFSTGSWVHDHPDVAREFARIVMDAAAWRSASSMRANSP